MSGNSPIPDRLKAASPGLGEAASADIESRAIELAMIDGRDAFTDADLARAAAELSGGSSDLLEPEIAAPVLAELTEWDAPVEQHGRQVDREMPDGETSVAELLIRDGIAEADHDQRVAAAEEAADDL